MALTTVFLQTLFIVFTVSAVHSSPARERVTRSGGFPKFPLTKFGQDQEEESCACGTRVVTHHPQRTGPSVATAKIIGGSSAPYGAYPWQVEIQAYHAVARKYVHHCGGAVVGDRLVITAAHCIANLEHPEKMRLIVGKVNLSAKDRHERIYKTEKFVIHPEFKKAGPHSNDIAVIKVKSTSEGGIDFNSHVRPICLPDVMTRTAQVGDWCTVTGWGAQKPEDYDSISHELRAAAVPLLEQEVCRKSEIYGSRTQSILDSMVCAGPLEGGTDACGGDSGGPLACQINGHFVLTGLVSWGDGCAKKNRPGVYTRVASYSMWIQETKNKLGV